MIRRLRGGVAVAALALALPALADPSALLLQAGGAARTASYRGVIVYRDARTTEVLRISHRVEDGRVLERLSTLTGAPRSVVSDGSEVACVIEGRPHRTAAASATGFPALSPAALIDAGRHYDLRETGLTRVAGRPCRGVAILPRDGFRYGYEICADEVTAVPLRIGLTDAEGNSLESLVFTEIEFGGGPAGAAAAPTVPPARARPASRAALPSTWSFGALPPGYAVTSRTTLPAHRGDPATEHVLLTDGLSAISVFAAPAAAGDAAEGLAQLGTVNAWIRRIGGVQVTVMGEVPAAAVRMVGEGLVPAGGAATAVSAR